MYMNKLRRKSIEELRNTGHYTSKIRQYTDYLNGVDKSCLKEVSSKLKINVKTYNPSAKSEKTKCIQGGAVKSYKTVELLRMSRDVYKPMIFLGATPNAAAKKYIEIQQGNTRRQRKDPALKTRVAPTHTFATGGTLNAAATVKSPTAVSSAQTTRNKTRVRPQRGTLKPAMTEAKVAESSDTESAIQDSLLDDLTRLIAAIKGDDDVSDLLKNFLANPIYEQLRSQWDPTKIVFTDPEDTRIVDGKDQSGGSGGPSAEQLLECYEIWKKVKGPIIKATLTSAHAAYEGIMGMIGFAKIQGVNMSMRGQKHIYMVLLKNQAVGFVQTPQDPQNIKQLNISEKTMLWWFKTMAGGEEKWLNSMADLTKETMVSIEQYAVLKAERTTERDDLVKSLLEKHCKGNLPDALDKICTFLLRINKLNEKDWKEFEALLGISTYSSSIETANKVNLNTSNLFLSVFALLLVVAFYMWFGPGENMTKYESEVKGSQVAMFKQLMGSLLGDDGRHIIRKGIFEPYMKHAIYKNHAVVAAVSALGLYTSYKAGPGTATMIASTASTAAVATMASPVYDYATNQLLDSPIPSAMTTLARWSTSLGTNSESLQEAIKMDCLSDLQHYKNIRPELLRNPVSYFTTSNKQKKDLLLDMLGTTVKCETWLVKEKKDEFMKEIKSKNLDRHYGFGLASTSVAEFSGIKGTIALDAGLQITELLTTD